MEDEIKAVVAKADLNTFTLKQVRKRAGHALCLRPPNHALTCQMKSALKEKFGKDQVKERKDWIKERVQAAIAVHHQQ